MKTKGFAGLIAVVVIVALVIAGYFVFAKFWKANNYSKPASQLTENTNQISPPAESSKPTPKPVVKKSGIKGTVTIHSCPGVQPMPGTEGPGCLAQSAANFSLIITNDVTGAQKSATTDSAGTFNIELAPGTYIIRANPNEEAQLTGDNNVLVQTGVFADIHLEFTIMNP